MSELFLRKILVVFAIIPCLAVGMGCEGTEVALKKEPLVQIPEPKAPEDQPKHLRPRTGSSAGMNRDPSGVVQP